MLKNKRTRNRPKNSLTSAISRIKASIDPYSIPKEVAPDPVKVRGSGFVPFKIHVDLFRPIHGPSPPEKLYGSLYDPAGLELFSRLGPMDPSSVNELDIHNWLMSTKIGIHYEDKELWDKVTTLFSLTSVKVWGNPRTNLVELIRYVAPNASYPQTLSRDTPAKNHVARASISFPPTYFSTMRHNGPSPVRLFSVLVLDDNELTESHSSTLIISGNMRMLERAA